MSKTITKKLDSYRALIVNSRNEVLAPLLAAQGIDAAFLDEGDTLFQDTMQLMEVQKKEYQDEREAFDTFFATKDGVEKTFLNTRDAVRQLSKNDPDLQNRLRRSEEHTSELQSRPHLVCRLLLEKKKE